MPKKAVSKRAVSLQPAVPAEPTVPIWLPPLAPKGMEVFNCFKRYLLLSGPKRSSKTISMVHKVVRHAFDVPRAEITIFSKNVKIAKEGGIWCDLTKIALPEWFKANIGCEYTTPPKQDGQTRSLFCGIRNRYGTETRIYLNSLDYDDDVEKLLFSRRFSMIVFSELSTFRKRKVFDAAIQSLRIVGLPYHMHQFIADTNPSDEGEMSWIYKLWWGEKDSDEFPASCVTSADKAMYQKQKDDLHRIEIMIEDNPFLSDDERDGLIASYLHDPDTYARYIEGKWVAASHDGFFSNLFRDEIHVIGDSTFPNPEDWEVLLPPKDVAEIAVGWDVGDKSPAVVFLCATRDRTGRNYWSIIDEIVVEDEISKMEDLVAAALAIMEKWEKYCGRPVLFRHYSDHSSFLYKIAAQSTEHLEIQRYSRNRIKLMATDAKYAGAAMDAVDLVKRLLFEGRLWVSAHCIHCRRMFKSLKPQQSKSVNGLTKIVKSAAVHPWDAFRYALLSCEPRSIASNMPKSGHARPRAVALA